MAAVVGGIYFNQKFPAKLMYDNLLININIVEQAKEFGLEKLVNVGTVCSYPKYCQIPFNEDELEKGEPDESNKPYGDVKRIALTLQKAYYDQYGLKSCFALPINLYGPRDSTDLENSHVIPGLIMKTLNAQKDNLPTVKFWGTGNPTRQMLHTRDLADGLILMAEKIDYPTPINFASSEEMTIKELAQKVFNILEYKGEAVWDTDKPDGQPRRKLNISKAKELLGWTPKVDFDTGLRETIEWYKANYHG
jgi:nucleoside-diphosphate-sugar epimerase